MSSPTTFNLVDLLSLTAEHLDVPPEVYEDAELKYLTVGSHLEAEDGHLAPYRPKIYVQGSFRLGTVVRPLSGEDEFDIDLVCRLHIEKEATTQEELKRQLGTRLQAHQDLAPRLKESRRCWTLEYPAAAGAPGFHMDVLPAIPNAETAPHGLLLTDTKLTRWQKSNPVEYAEWFKERMKVTWNLRKSALAEQWRSDVEAVPDFHVKTPLQRCVQILKRHRDIAFQGREDDKPVSIIITTLAAHAYNNEADVPAAMQGIVARMADFITYESGRYRVMNPVDGGENFADKWHEYPDRRQAFMAWLETVRADFDYMTKAASLNEAVERLDRAIGPRTMERVAKSLGFQPQASAAMAAVGYIAVPPLADASHAISPEARYVVVLNQAYTVTVSGEVHLKQGGGASGRGLRPLQTGSAPKNVWLKFTARTNLPSPFTIRWQVVNTGTEAHAAEQPRGGFEDCNDGKNIRWESTSYRGTHWVEAFVFDGADICVARSGRIYVKVR